MKTDKISNQKIIMLSKSTFWIGNLYISNFRLNTFKTDWTLQRSESPSIEAYQLSIILTVLQINSGLNLVTKTEDEEGKEEKEENE
jgi:hypothetical protein